MLVASEVIVNSSNVWKQFCYLICEGTQLVFVLKTGMFVPICVCF
jgi:hypothetical protein